jgi:copper chaperone CopZ
LPADLVRPLLLGVVLAGLIGALAPADLAARLIGPGALSILVMMIVGIPLYVCATASVPLAVGFMHLGVSPGAALAFLIAGPATNAATLTTIGRVLGRRTLVIFLAVVAASAFGAGLLLDAVLPWVGRVAPGLDHAGHHHEHVGPWAHAAAVALLAVLVHAWWRARRPSRAAAAATPAAEAAPAAATASEFAVGGMNCSHCQQSVTRAIVALPGVSACEVDLAGARARVTGSAVDLGAVVAAVEALGFTCRPLPR